MTQEYFLMELEYKIISGYRLKATEILKYILVFGIRLVQTVQIQKHFLYMILVLMSEVLADIFF